MALDALCGLPQRSGGPWRGVRVAFPAAEDALHGDFEALQLDDKGEMDPMQLIRPPFVSL